MPQIRQNSNKFFDEQDAMKLYNLCKDIVFLYGEYTENDMVNM